MSDLDWQPVSSVEALLGRAKIIEQLRTFFAERSVMEVETPLLGAHSVSDPHMDAIRAESPSGATAPYFLQTSPEYAMKRMLAAGFGSIFQICKSFRQGEQGSRHNPEFTMLEWYRPGFDHFDLMEEVSELFVLVLRCNPCKKITYRKLFEQFLNVDPHSENSASLERIARSHIDVQMQSDNKDDWLNLLLAEVIEPQIGIDSPLFIYNYPASQCALAKVNTDDEGVLVAERFELYFRGMELANGYHELTNADEQRDRFAKDRLLRQQLNRPDVGIDQKFLAALDRGLPDCAGVALGVDRLVMIALGVDSIDQVLSFPSSKA
jgi:lysyl-tRNA synthetase class 2